MKYLITKDGLRKLKEELSHLRNVERPRVTDAITAAVELGDLPENAEFDSALERQNEIDIKISKLLELISKAEVVDVSKLSGKIVRFGATVKLRNINTNKDFVYKIVGGCEVEAEDNLLSVDSPMARALIGKEEGEIVEVHTPRGLVEYEILEVKFV